MLTCDDYLRPRTLADAFDAIEANHGRYRLVAGATDILPWAREGRGGDVHIPVLIDIAGIAELSSRELSGSRVRLGAATPFQRFLDDPALTASLPAMPRCAVWFADDQIRESATIGGNLVNASPAADGTPALLAHDAVLELAARQDGQIVRRQIALRDFLTGPGSTLLARDEILVGIDCEARPGYGGAFEKVGHRRSLVISTVCVAALARVSADGRLLQDVRLAVAGIGPVPQRIVAAEQLLAGHAIDAGRLEQAADLAVPLVASRTRQQYRREVVRGFVVRALLNAARRGGADPAAFTPQIEATYA